MNTYSPNNCRFTIRELNSVINDITRIYNTQNVHVITDYVSNNIITSDTRNVIDCADHYDDLKKLRSNQDIVIIATDCDDVGAWVITLLEKIQIPYIGMTSWTKPSSFYHKNSLWRKFAYLELERQKEEGFSKWNGDDYDTIAQAIYRTRNLDGHYVEVGCFNGSSGSVAVGYTKALKIHRKMHFFDLFDGFTNKASISSLDTRWKNTHMTDGYEIVQGRLKYHETDEVTVNVHKLDIIESHLPSEIDKISVANVDTDLREAVYHGLIKCAPLIQPNGILMAEDPAHCPALLGAERAVQDFIKHPLCDRFIPFSLSRSHTMFICTG